MDLTRFENRTVVVYLDPAEIYKVLPVLVSYRDSFSRYNVEVSLRDGSTITIAYDEINTKDIINDFIKWVEENKKDD